MKPTGNTIAEILSGVSVERSEAFNKWHNVIVENLPRGFEASISYGALGYVVPHSIYPAGYHCKPEEPLPFAGLSSQKYAINLYHMGIYSNPELLKWFIDAYPKYTRAKLDIGKSCIRFKKPVKISFQLIGQLMRQMTVQEWINIYESKLKK